MDQTLILHRKRGPCKRPPQRNQSTFLERPPWAYRTALQGGRRGHKHMPAAMPAADRYGVAIQPTAKLDTARRVAAHDTDALAIRMHTHHRLCAQITAPQLHQAMPHVQGWRPRG